MWRVPGSGLSRALLASEAAMVTDRPSRTSPAAAASRYGVMWPSAPRRSSAPPGTWPRSRSWSARKLAVDITEPLIDGS
jgi:hypothetical protein